MIYIGDILVEVTEAPGKKLKLSFRSQMFGVEAELGPADIRTLIRYLESKLEEK